MPTCKDYPEIPVDEIQSKFALLPTLDMNGKTLWLKSYWVYGTYCEVGFFALRASKNDYPTVKSFWDSIRFRIPNMF